MRCPACHLEMRIIQTEGLTVDVCKGGCGGIWLDRVEYEKVDQKNESAGKALLNIERDPSIRVNYELRRMCPRCDNMVLMRRFSSVKHVVEIDKCPYCGGYWLDGGEIDRIRDLFATQQDKEEATKAYFEKFTADAVKKYEEESKQNDKSTIRRFFRFFSPS